MQDSCNYIRNYGLADVTREIMSYLVEPGYFVEMTPNREHNYCCGGGGGFNGIGIYRQQRNVGLKVKRDQILATGAKLVVTPCHNCWDAIRDLEEVYELGIKLELPEAPAHQDGHHPRAPQAQGGGRGRVTFSCRRWRGVTYPASTGPARNRGAWLPRGARRLLFAEGG